MPSDKNKIQETRIELDRIGPGFCLEKWNRAAIYLQTGHTHSCHHPGPHFIPIEEISKSPSALHNTQHKKEQRKIMLTGGRPVECDYCWKVEDSDPTVFSDRHIASSRYQLKDQIEKIVTSGWDYNHNPSSLDINFSNACNFACAYCNPKSSSKWQSEITTHGPYPTSEKYNLIDSKIYLEKEDNPYVEAFWNWWPDVYPGLDSLRITGGEPLLTKHTYTLLDKILENPNPNLSLFINTNLGVDLEKFITAISKIQPGRDVKRIRIFTSNESYGKKAEYTRYGMNYKEWLANIELLLNSLPNINVGIMATYNILSVSSFTKFLKDMKQINTKFEKDRISVSIQYLKDPDFLDIRLLPKEWRHYLEESLEYLENNFNEFESAERFRQVISYFDTDIEDKERKLKDFKIFINEYDLRRNLNFLTIFPEYREII